MKGEGCEGEGSVKGQGGSVKGTEGEERGVCEGGLGIEGSSPAKAVMHFPDVFRVGQY